MVKRMTWISKLANFGSQKKGPKRAAIVPKDKTKKAIKLFGKEDVRVIIEEV